MSPEQLARRIAAIADSKGAREIVALDMRGLVSYTDFLVIHLPNPMMLIEIAASRR